MTDQEVAEIRRMIREETERVVSAHLHVFSVACMSPICNSINELQKSIGLVLDGQTLVEKHLAYREDEGEGWRET
ncbi:MAG: hypothetical protein CMJ58_18805 [Planctomycetaceae bacterium]|nr:hypothetical protein [Planctomycetaceae bacterium]